MTTEWIVTGNGRESGSGVRSAAVAALWLALAPGAWAEQFVVRFETEAAGLQTSTATFSAGGQETFESVATGSGIHYTSDFGTGGVIQGVYTDLQVNGADQYGGADGSGRYAVTFQSTGYEIRLSTSLAGGVNYFGYWLSALDANNVVTFYRGADALFEFTPADLLAMVSGHAEYYGNPNANFAGQNAGEPYAFVNFFDEGGYFDRIVFRQVAGGGYESDNHTVGRWLTQGTGTLLSARTVTVASAVPEPRQAWLLLAGAAMLTIRARRHRPGHWSAD